MNGNEQSERKDPISSMANVIALERALADAAPSGGGLAGRTVSVDVDDLAVLAAENVRLRERVTELQTMATQFVTTLRDIRARSLRAQVSEFHRAIGQRVEASPCIPPEDTSRLRVRLVLEEAFEFAEAIAAPDARHIVRDLRDEALGMMATIEIGPDLPALADACADLDYVVEGTRLAYGIDGAPIAAEVHRANMGKIGGPVDAHGKQRKPDGWMPPDVEGLLRAQGWRS